MIETLLLAVNIEEEQLESAKKENWDGPTMQKALEGLNETAQNIHTARAHGRVSKKMERVMFKRLGKVAKSYMSLIRTWNTAHPQPKVEIGELKITQTEFEDGTVVTELEPAEVSVGSDGSVELVEAAKDEVDLSMQRPLKEQVKLRTDGFAAPNKIRDAMAMERMYESSEADAEE